MILNVLLLDKIFPLKGNDKDILSLKLIPIVDGEMVASAADPLSPAALEALAGRLQILEARVAALDGLPVGQAVIAATWTQPMPALVPVEEPGPGATEVMGLIGRACLIMGGAFLLRIATDSGVLPALAGVGLTLAYCGLWAVLADRHARKGAKTWASFQILTAAVIAFPMVWETTFRFHYLPASQAAAALLCATLLFLGVALRQGLGRTAWVVLLGALATAFSLMVATSAMIAFTGFFILLGGASLLVSDHPEWRGLRWPAALFADGVVAVIAGLALAPGGNEALAQDLQAPRVLAMTLALTVVYLGAILYRTLNRPKAVGAFEVFQAFAVMAAGYGGAIRVAHATGSGVLVLGAAALVLGLGCYGCAFAFAGRQVEGSRDFAFLTALGLVLILSGGPLLLPGPVMVLVSLALGLGATVQARRLRSFPLQLQGGLFLLAAAWSSGLLGGAWAALAVPGLPDRHGIAGTGVCTLVALVAAHGLDLRGREPAGASAAGERLVALGVAALGVLALGGGLVTMLALLTRSDLGALAVVRTAVLVLLALAAAAAGRWRPASELPWLAYPLLGLTALKILLEDFPHGRPATLFLALTLLGCGLLAVGKCARPSAAATPV